MEIDIEALTFELSSTRRRYTESAVKHALGASAGHIDRVSVRLSEFRAADGDLHTRCLVWVELDSGSTEVSHSGDAEPCFAIDRATDQVSWKVARAVRHETQTGNTGCVNASLPTRMPLSADNANRRGSANRLGAA